VKIKYITGEFRLEIHVGGALGAAPGGLGLRYNSRQLSDLELIEKDSVIVSSNALQ
jgi:hypothetical protein